MSSKEKTALQPFDEIFKKKGWKKVAGFFVKEIDESTLAHFNQPFCVRDVVRVQCGVTNKALNKVSWRIFGLPEKFGTLRDHLINASKCYLNFANVSIEFKLEGLEFDQAAEKIESICIGNAEKYSKFDSIKIEALNHVGRNQTEAFSVLLCIDILMENYAEARRIVEHEKINNISFDLSVFALAEKNLKRS